MCAVDCEEIKIFHGEICFGACSKVATGVATHQPIGKTVFHHCSKQDLFIQSLCCHGSKQDIFISLHVAMVSSSTSSYIYVLLWFWAAPLHISMCSHGSEKDIFIHLCVAMVLSRTSSYICVLLCFWEGHLHTYMCFGGHLSLPCLDKCVCVPTCGFWRPRKSSFLSYWLSCPSRPAQLMPSLQHA